MVTLNTLLFSNIHPRQIVIKNTIWLGLAQGLSRLLKLVLVVVSARLLGPQGFGTFNYVLSIMSVYFLLSDWGINTLVVRDYQQKKDIERYVNTGATLKTVLAIASFVVASIGVFVFENQEFRTLGAILAFYLLFENIREFSATFFRAVQKMEKEFLVIGIEVISTTLIGIGLLLVYRHVFSLAYAYVLGAAISVVAGIIAVRRLFSISWQWDWDIVRYYLKQGMPLVLFGLLGFVFFSTDQIVLGHFRGTEEVGYYSIASKLVYLAVLLPTIIVGALSPYIASHTGNTAHMRRIFGKITGGLILLGAMVVVAGYVLSFLIPVFFGAEYGPAIPMFHVLLWVLIGMFPTAFLDAVLVAYHKQWQNFAVTAICAILNFVLAYVWVRGYGAWGVISATLIAQSLNFIMTLFLSRKVIQSHA